jgi:mannose-6-phosphate isomerase-like protein (cupin superfamily)
MSMQRVNESECAYRGGDSGVKYLMRGPRIDWGVILLLPGQSLGGHYHEQVEETFYILQGEGIFDVNGAPVPVALGDVLRMEPTDRHDIHNRSEQPLKMVFIKCPYLPKDKVDI